MTVFRRIVSISGTLLGICYPFFIFVLWRRVGPPSLLLYWPTLVSLFFLISFGRTLWFSPPFVERLARLQNPHLTPAEVVYCRRVTQLWCAFFVMNGSIALYLARYGSLRAWTLYCGLISYLLVGFAFTAEYSYRHWRFRPKGAFLSNWMNRWTSNP